MQLFRRTRRTGSGPIQPLERRVLLAVSAVVDGGGRLDIDITGTDNAAVTVSGGNVKINGNDPSSGPAAASSITELEVQGSDQPNIIDLSGVTTGNFTSLANGKVTVEGNDGNDTITGSDFGDLLNGKTGADSINGGGGNDSLDGGSGADPDTLIGGAGGDCLLGGDGDDSMLGGTGSDVLIGGMGNDVQMGEGDEDKAVIVSGEGSDSYDGGAGNNSVQYQGDFTLADTVLIQSNAAAGFDKVVGTSPVSTSIQFTNSRTVEVFTFGGASTITGLALNATTFVRAIVIFTGTSADVVDLSGQSNPLVSATVGGGGGNDSITGGAGPDLIAGEGGNDVLAGGPEDDTVIGGLGDDSIDGGSGNDQLIGDSGADSIVGGSGNDFIQGGAGVDDVSGGPDDDFVSETNVRVGFALGTNNQLIHFELAGGPITFLPNIPITGLQVGETARQIAKDLSGHFYVFTDQLRVYDLLPYTGGAIAPRSLAAVLAGDVTGFSIQPSGFFGEIITDEDELLEFNLVTGGTLSQRVFSYDPDDFNADANPFLGGTAHWNVRPGTMDNPRFHLDTDLDVLTMQHPKFGSKLTTVGPLGLNATGPASLDFTGDNTLYGKWDDSGISKLYSIDPLTGEAQEVSSFGLPVLDVDFDLDNDIYRRFYGDGNDIIQGTRDYDSLLVSGNEFANVFSMGFSFLGEYGVNIDINAMALIDVEKVFMDGGDGPDDFTIDVGYLPAQSVPEVEFNGGAGNDTADATLMPLFAPGVTLNGGANDDSLIGSPNGDWVIGDSGNDTTIGGGGRDTHIGGTGSDEISGDPLYKMVALNANGNLDRFNESGDVSSIPITGLIGGEQLIAIELLNLGPLGFELVAIGKSGTMYDLEAGSGVATPQALTLEPFEGNAFAVHPVAGRFVSVISDNGMAFIVDALTGETTLMPSVTPGLVGSAQAEAYAPIPSTTLMTFGFLAPEGSDGVMEFFIDATNDRLLRREPEGPIVDVGPLGIDVTGDAGLAIDPSDSIILDNFFEPRSGSKTFALLKLADNSTGLYDIDLLTGAATLVRNRAAGSSLIILPLDDSIYYSQGDGSDTVNGGAGIDRQIIDIEQPSVNIAPDAPFHYKVDLGVAGEVRSFSVETVRINGDNNPNTLTIITGLSAATSPYVIFYGYGGDDMAVTTNLPAGGYGASLNGGEHNDTLYGSPNGDILRGGVGSNTLAGHEGDDVYGFDADDPPAFDIAIEQPGEGNDTLDFSRTRSTPVTVSLSLASPQFINTLILTLTNPADFENLLGGGMGDLLHGNEADNIIDGGDGPDVMFGGNGEDGFISDGDGDTADGGAGTSNKVTVDVSGAAGQPHLSTTDGMTFTITDDVGTLATFVRGQEVDIVGGTVTVELNGNWNTLPGSQMSDGTTDVHGVALDDGVVTFSEDFIPALIFREKGDIKEVNVVGSDDDDVLSVFADAEPDFDINFAGGDQVSSDGDRIRLQSTETFGQVLQTFTTDSDGKITLIKGSFLGSSINYTGLEGSLARPTVEQGLEAESRTFDLNDEDSTATYKSHADFGAMLEFGDARVTFPPTPEVVVDGKGGADFFLVQPNSGTSAFPDGLDLQFFGGGLPGQGDSFRIDSPPGSSSKYKNIMGSDLPGSGGLEIEIPGSSFEFSFNGIDKHTGFLDGFDEVTIVTHNADDLISITSDDAVSNRINAISGGEEFVDLVITNVQTLTLDLASNDGGAGNDQVIISTAGLVATGLTRLNLHAGTGSNVIHVWGGDFILDTNGGVGGVNLTVDVNNPGTRVKFDATQTLAALDIAAGAEVEMTSSGSNVLVTKQLILAGGTSPTGILDLKNNHLVIDYDAGSPLATITAQLKSGYNFGAWTGLGIHSSSAAGDSSRALGVGESSVVLGGSGGDFFGVNVDGTAVLGRYTFYGDATLNGSVNKTDLGKLAINWHGAGGWTSGDFDFSGFMDVLDLYRLALNWLAGEAPGGPAVAAPTITSVSQPPPPARRPPVRTPTRIDLLN